MSSGLVLLAAASIVLSVFFGTLAIVSLLTATRGRRISPKVVVLIAILSFLAGVGFALLTALL